MESVKARQIIDNLLNDSDLYQQMSEKEGQVWGAFFSNETRNSKAPADQNAAKELRINRDMLDLVTVLKRHHLQPEIGCSLACGSGRAERQLLTRGVCQRFHGIDIAADALAEATKLAEQSQMSITYEQADLNKVRLEKQTYDLVVTQNCLHHVLHLEYVADEIAQSLRPGGVLWVHDYIGETQFQYSDERLEIVNQILALLPERMRHNQITGQQIDRIVRQEPGTLISPFESIRSAEIMPVFLERFEIVEEFEFSSILHLVSTVGTREAYLKNEESRSLFEFLFFLDRLLIRTGVLPPAGGQYLLKPKV